MTTNLGVRIGALSLLLGCLAVASPAAAATPTLGPGFQNPTEINDIAAPPIAVATSETRAPKGGHCTGPSAFTSREPLLRFKVTEAFEASFEVVGSHSCLNIFFPDGTVMATKGRDSRPRTTWIPGEYAVYAAFTHYTLEQAAEAAAKGRFTARFFDTERPLHGATTPHAVVAQGFDNPLALTGMTAVANGVVPSDVGLGGGTECTSVGTETSAQAVFTFEVRDRVAFALDVRGAFQGLLIRTPDGGFLCAFRDQRLRRTWEPGRYAVRLLNQQAGTPVSVEFIDAKRPPHIAADVRVERVGRLDAPRWITGTTQERRDDVYQDCGKGFPRQPDVVIATERPLEELEIRLFDATGQQALHVEGPLADGTPYRQRDRCDQRRTHKLADGRYGVFIGDGDDVGPRPFSVLVTEKKTVADPLLAVPHIPEGLAPAARATDRFFPYFAWPEVGKASVALLEQHVAIFARAPESLRVYPKDDLDDVTAKTSLSEEVRGEAPGFVWPRRGEALLVVGASDQRGEWLFVRTADGEAFRVLASQLVTTPPDAVWIPERPRRVHALDTYDFFAVAVSDTERRALERFEEQRKKADACFYAYWDKHHAGSGEWVEIKYRNGRVVGMESYTDKVRQRGEKRCGIAQVAKAQGKLTEELSASYARQRQAALDTLRAQLAAR